MPNYIFTSGDPEILNTEARDRRFYVPAPHVVKLYNFTFNAAEINPYGWPYSLFATEMIMTGDSFANDELHTDIAAFIIGS